LAREHAWPLGRAQLATATQTAAGAKTDDLAPSAISFDFAVVNHLVDLVVERVAAAVAERVGGSSADESEWFDSRHAADYLGVHRDTLRKLAAARAIPAEQDGPGCKLYFRRCDLNAWRHSGGKPRHLASTIAAVA
jgi:excisionase family DNA binding protein